MDTKHIDDLLAAHGIEATHYAFEGAQGTAHVWATRRGQVGLTTAGKWYAFVDYPDAELLDYPDAQLRAYTGAMDGFNTPEAAVEALANHLSWASEAWEDYETLRVFGPDFEDGDFDAREMYE